jgi:hypothetical protein
MHFERIERVLVASVTETLAGGSERCDVAVAAAPAPEESANVVATIGFGAEYARGSITLLGARAVVAALQFAGDDEPSDALLCDALGELVNGVLGHLKNRLLSCGVTLLIGLPTTGIARKIWLRQSDDTFSAWHRIEVEAGALYLRFDASFDAEFVLGEPTPLASGPVVAEGDMVLF